MSTLQERLDKIRAGFVKQVPEDALAVVNKATEDLRSSGIVSRILGKGELLPAFELMDTEGSPVHSAALIGKGPLVLSFYRGVW